jgi:hypothetical protein
MNEDLVTSRSVISETELFWGEEYRCRTSDGNTSGVPTWNTRYAKEWKRAWPIIHCCPKICQGNK